MRVPPHTTAVSVETPHIIGTQEAECTHAFHFSDPLGAFRARLFCLHGQGRALRCAVMEGSRPRLIAAGYALDGVHFFWVAPRHEEDPHRA